MTANYRLALRAYPRDYRLEHGGELVAIANELADDRWSGRQARSLLAGGLRTRARLGSGGTSRGLWVDGIGLALIAWLFLRAVPPLAYALGVTGDVVAFGRSPWSAAATLLVPAFALTVTTRWPAAVVVTVSGGIDVVLRLLEAPLGPFGYEVAANAAALALTSSGLAWWLAVRGDGRPIASPATAGLVLVVFVGSAYPSGSPDGLAAATIVLLGFPAAGLALVTVDPRPAIAATVVWTLLILTLVPYRLLLPPELDWEALVVTLVALVGVTIGVLLSRFGTRRVLADP